MKTYNCFHTGQINLLCDQILKQFFVVQQTNIRTVLLRVNLMG